MNLATLSPKEVERINRVVIAGGRNRDAVGEILSRKGFGKMPTTRAQNPSVGGVFDVIDQPIYDTVTFAAAAAMAKTVLFQTPIGQGGKTLALTNMTKAGMLEFPQRLLITSIKVYIANNTAPADLQNILSNVSFTLTIGLKPFLQCPLANLPAGMGGITVSAANLGTTANLANFSQVSTTNGMPDQRVVYSLTQPIPLDSGEGFSVTLNPETGFNFSAANANPPGNGTVIQVYLDGVLTRGVQ